MNPRKLEHGFRRISARIPYTLPEGHEDNDVPTFWLLLYGFTVIVSGFTVHWHLGLKNCGDPSLPYVFRPETQNPQEHPADQGLLETADVWTLGSFRCILS